jgi:ubiquinone/menaquinone biosynthesis C-methylase UbiE
MTAADDRDEELRGFVGEWTRALVEKDLAAAGALREEGYIARLPGEGELSRAQEMAMIGAADFHLEAIDARNLRVRRQGEQGRIDVDFFVRGASMGTPIETLYHVALAVRNSGGRWRATHSSVEEAGGPLPDGFREDRPGRQGGLKRLVPRKLRPWLKAKLKRIAPTVASFQDLAYLPHKPGSDYVIPPLDPPAGPPGAELPIPPRELWLGYNYPAHGKLHVDRMLDIVGVSGFAFGPGDRILDLGCGAGRMIRHLRPLAATCEIWGADISADHIIWCKRHLSPPFHFVTTTKVPHLPFEDRSFRLVYCGSLFTHIDDLADAWLLELRRILAPGGRAYLTIHDNATIEQFERPPHASAAIVRTIKAARTYQEAKGSFGMFTVGRDHESQVFYDRAYFSAMVGNMFDLVSVTPEAYFYQTAYLLERRGG